MPAVLGELPQDVEKNPPQRHRPGPMTGEHGVEVHPRDCGMRALHGSPIVSGNAGDRVRGVEEEGVLGVVRQPVVDPAPAGDRLTEPDGLDEHGVLEQSQQAGSARH